MMTKEQLRKTLLIKIKSMTPSHCFEQSMQAWKALYATAIWEQADAILAYYPMIDELDSESMLLYALECGKKLYLPRIDGKNVIFYEVTSVDDLEPSRSGFMQPPRTAKRFEASLFRHPLIIAPCLGANRAGFRLGRGSGNYDRFLGTLYHHYSHATTLVVSYSDNITDDFVQEPHDQPFTYILSNLGLQAAMN